MRCFTSGLALLVPCSALWAQFAVSDLPRLRNFESERTSSFDRSGGNGDYRSLKSGETLTLFSSSLKDRLAAVQVPGARVIDRRVPVRVLNFSWHRVGVPSRVLEGLGVAEQRVGPAQVGLVALVERAVAGCGKLRAR